MNHSADPDKIVDTLVREGILVLSAHNKHKKYRINEQFRSDPAMGIFNCSISPSDWRAPKKVVSELRRKLKPGTLEKAMGWTNPSLNKEPVVVTAAPGTDVTQVAIDALKAIEANNKKHYGAVGLVHNFSPSTPRVDSKSISHAGKADKVPSHLVLPPIKLKEEEKPMLAVLEAPQVTAPPVVMAPPPAPTPKPVPVIVPSAPTTIVAEKAATPVTVPTVNDMKVPDKMSVDGTNPHAKILCDLYNSSIDRAAELRKTIQQRERTIRDLGELNLKESKELKDSLAYIEQLSYALIAVPETTVAPKEEAPVPPPVPQAPPVQVAPPPPDPAVVSAPVAPPVVPQTKLKYRPVPTTIRAVNDAIGLILKEQPDKCFTAQQIADALREKYDMEREDLVKYVHNVISLAKQNKWPTTYKWHQRGLYTHKGND